MFATHLHELAGLVPTGTVASVHLKVEYDAATDRLIYHRSLAPGSGSALYGLEVCRALDLPAGYLDRATAIRKQLAGWTAPHRSVYSAEAVIDRCEVCAKETGLEAHHIIPQALASNHTAGNMVCLCTACHDDHHGGRLEIHGWEETSEGRRLKYMRKEEVVEDEVSGWIREQRHRKIAVATIQRMAKQIFGLPLTAKQIRSI